MGLVSRMKNAWNAFTDTDSSRTFSYTLGTSSSRPDFRNRGHIGNERSIVNSVYNRIAVDVSQINLEHARVDGNNRYLEPIDSGLNYALTQEANIDQTGKSLIQDAVMSMFDEGTVAIVPVDTVGDPLMGSYDIKTVRVGRIVQWYPRHVQIELYNDRTGNKETVTLPKEIVAIVQNPFYSIMNEPNSTLQRLIHKLNLLDYIDDQSGSGKMNLIVQLPYQLKSEMQKTRAATRQAEIEAQLKDSKFGIAYIDATEHITQLNRPVENNLLDQIKNLTDMLYSQLGLTTDIMNGTASEAVMKNYYKRTVNTILDSFQDEIQRKFLTKTARSQGQAIVYFNDVFSLIPATDIANMADAFARNEILTSNELRSIIGFKPSSDPKADTLTNSNLYPADGSDGGQPSSPSAANSVSQEDSSSELTDIVGDKSKLIDTANEITNAQ
jgi:hypothetical protein